MNKTTMDKYRPEMKKFYYDASKYATYLEQLGIKYPTVRTDVSSAGVSDAGEDQGYITACGLC
jgi:aminobenzoyl-glutamate utilization protein B